MREDPKHGSEPEEEGSGESEGGGEALDNFDEFQRRSGEGGEDVEAGKADHGAEEDAEEGLRRRGPELFIKGEGSERDSEEEQAGDDDEAEPENEAAGFFVITNVVDQ